MRILVTGGAGFIGSNLVDYFLGQNYEVVCLDNLSTGYEKNIAHNYQNKNFTFINGDIREIDVCRFAVEGCDVVSHQAALGSVPRSIKDPETTNAVNIDGFLNILIASRDAKIKRFVYASSSSTYGDSKKLPKIEDEIGKPLSPYAVTKYVNELYAEIFAKTYGMQCIGLRYFNVFGKRQDPNGAYAAVIPLWVKQLISNQRPVINGDGTYSRDFTFIENVIHANEKALFTTSSEISRGLVDYYNVELEEHKYAIKNDLFSGSQIPELYCFSEIFNIAFGENTTLFELFNALKESLSEFDTGISDIEPIIGPHRIGDIPHSQASILKAQSILKYQPVFSASAGFKLAAQWYYENMKSSH